MATLKKISGILRRRRYREALLRFRVAAGVEHQPIVRPLDFDLLVDVGANVGQFSLIVSELKTGCQIVAFEPLAEAASIYRKVFQGDDLVTLHQTAIGPDRQDSEMHVSKRADSSSLLPISDAQVELFPGTEEARRETVKVAPLTDFLNEEHFKKTTLMKIDVQGFELDVLRSAAPILHHINWIYVESSFLPLYSGQALVHDVLKFLLDNDFRMKGIYNPAYDNNELIAQADFLFEKETG